MLEANELLVVGGELIREFLPPSLLGRVLGEREEERAPRPGDLVVVEEPLDLPRLQAGSGPLVSADLGGRPFQRRGDGVSALALAFPDLAQLRGKSAAPDRGTSWHGHPASLLPGERGRDQCGTHFDIRSDGEIFTTPHTGCSAASPAPANRSMKRRRRRGTPWRARGRWAPGTR